MQRKNAGDKGPLEKIRHALLAQVDGWRQSRRRGHRLRKAHLVLTSLPEGERFREVAFALAIVALAAKLAQVDGVAGEAEYRTFRELFPMPEGDDRKIDQLFRSACEDTSDALIYARQIAALYPPVQHREMLEDVLLRLLKIAATDGAPEKSERALLCQIGEVFGMSTRAVSRLLKDAQQPLTENPYVLLRVQRDWSDRQIRNAYLKQVREHHPDTVQARGGDAEALRLAGTHIAVLNAAYARICLERGVKT